MKFTFSRVIFALLALASPVIAESLDLPSQGLENRVEFWKKVFTQYGEDDIIIHDRFYVNLIYDVAHDYEKNSKITAVRWALDEIRNNLDTPENLSVPAQQIRDAVVANGISISAQSLQQLRDNVHTQLGIKERFREGIIRSGRYVNQFQEIFEKAGLPSQIALLPLVESSFENRALSNAGAAGIWQFTRGTGRLYLRISKTGDERLDPQKATRAAARLLSENYRALGSWPLAITAYNHGRAGMLRAQDAHGSDITTIINEYQSPIFGYASMNFYSEFLAAVEVYQDHQQYFGELTLDTPSTSKPAASARRPVPLVEATTTDKYKVKKGDTLWDIAQRFGVSIRELMEANDLRNSAIHAGQILLIK